METPDSNHTSIELSGRYDAFISYSHADCKDIASPIQKKLQNIGKPWYRELSTNLKIYRDQTNLNASESLWHEIETALNTSQHFILLASPQAAQSKWIEKEVGVWINRATDQQNGLQKIFIVLCDGDIAWSEENADFDWSSTNCLPPVLSGQFKSEPLWIDLKKYIEHKDNQKIIRDSDFGFSEEIARVIGAIINKPPVEIISKELQRVKRLRRIYILAIVLLLGLSVTSLLFFIEQKEATLKAQQANEKLVETNDSLILQKQETERQLENFKIEAFNRNMRNAKIFFEAKEYCLANAAYDSAYNTAGAYKNNAEVMKNRNELMINRDSCKKLCVE